MHPLATVLSLANKYNDLENPSLKNKQSLLEIDNAVLLQFSTENYRTTSISAPVCYQANDFFGEKTPFFGNFLRFLVIMRNKKLDLK